MLKFRTLWLAMLVLVFAGCQQAPRAPDSDDTAATAVVRKSPNDDRQYRYLELGNELKVLLVSDPDTDKAAASLVVFRGSFHEPPEYPGLAHFLEHMLFIGTEKYPVVDDYMSFINQHGGMTNAYTAGDHTNYFFDIRPEQLDPALDRFAQFFVAPLLDTQYVDREKHAVHSEYQMQLRADNWRADAVSSVAMNPEHPNTRFNIGSLETLGDGVQDALVKFYESHYSADQMALVVLSNASLDQLEAWVTPKFGAIPNRHIGAAAPMPPLFSEAQLPAVLTYQSIKRGYKVGYNFPVPSPERYYEQKPDAFLTNLLGHEGEGSLKKALLDRGWIEALAAGCFDVDGQSGVLGIDIDLTPAGYAALDRVTDLVFDYLERLSRAPEEAWRYSEQARVAELAFRFQEQSSATSFVYQVGPRLMRIPARDVLIAPYLMEDFEPALIREFLGRLNPDNVLMTVSGPDVGTDQRERWFGVPYHLEHRALARQAVTADELALPAPNPFLPERLDMLSADPMPPTKVVERPDLELWLDRDTEFGTPRGNLMASLAIEGGIRTVEDRAYAELYTAMVQDALIARLYPAYLAGLGYNLSVDGYGLKLDISGYSDKQIELARVVLAGIMGLEIDPDRFALIKARLVRELQNFREERPYTQAMRALRDLVLSNGWPPAALAEVLEGATPAGLADWKRNRLDGFHVQGLLHGNIRQADADALAEALEKALPLADFPRQAPEVRLITRSARLSLESDHDDAAMVVYLQDHDASLAERARTALTANILQQDYFTQLRTEEQLGYVVGASNQPLRDRGGIAFVVQSPVASSAALVERTRRFLAEEQVRFESLSEADFVLFREGLASRLREADKNLGQRGDRLWSDLDLGFTAFDSREQIADAVEALSKIDVSRDLEALNRAFDERSLIIFAPGKFADTPVQGSEITDVASYKRGD